MKASHKGFTNLASSFLMGVVSTHIDWTSKIVVVFFMGVLTAVLITVAAAMSHAKKDGESDGG